MTNNKIKYKICIDWKISISNLSSKKKLITVILITLHWNEVFHIHCDALNKVIDCVLAQKIIRYLDSLIFYTNKLLN